MIKIRNKRSKKESPKRKDLSEEHIDSIKKAKENKLNPRSRMVCFNGMLFNSIKDFAQAYGYDASTVCSWLNKRYEPVNKAFITVRYATELDLKNKNNVRYDAKTMGRLKDPVYNWTAYFNAEAREEEQALDRYYNCNDVSIHDGDKADSLVYLGSKDDENKDIDNEVLFDYIEEDDSFDYIEDDYMYDDFEIM